MLLLSAATCTGSAQGDVNPAMVLYNDTVVLTEGNFTFMPSNASVSYEISNFTDMGALSATGLDFKVTDLGKMAGEMNGNMTEKTFVLESIEGYQNNNETQEKWFILINGVMATENIGMNPVNANDTVSFVYAPEEAGRPVLEGAKYLVEIGISTETQMPDIIETATAEGFKTFRTALNATNLTDTLKGEGPFTVFAPTDKAFAALPNGTLKTLLNDTEALKKILLYHVAGEKLTAEDVANMTSITTLQGSELPVNVTEEGVFVGDAKIIVQDLNASNGVIHAIDAVLIPPEPAPEQNLTVLYNDTVSLNEGNVKFRQNVTRNYKVDNLTDFGALYATGLDFNASLMQNMTNMTNVSFVLRSIEGIGNNNTTGEKWFVYINGVPAEENFGMNKVNDGDKLSFWYTIEEGGKAAIKIVFL